MAIGDPIQEATWCLDQVSRAAFIYLVMYHAFRWIIPIVSTILAGILAAKQQQGKPSSKPIVIFSIVVSVLTILNTTIDPGKEHDRFATIRNKFRAFIVNYEIVRQEAVLKNKDLPNAEQLILEWKRKKNDELDALIQEWSTGSAAVVSPGLAEQSAKDK